MIDQLTALLAQSRGALHDHAITMLIQSGAIKGVPKRSIPGPASLDLTFSEEAYRVPGLRMLQEHETVFRMLKTRNATRHDLTLPMEPGRSYLVRLNEALELPRLVYGFANPRSKSGRNDILARMMAKSPADRAAPGSREDCRRAASPRQSWLAGDARERRASSTALEGRCGRRNTQ